MRAKRTGAAVSGCYGFSAHSRLSGLTVVIAAAAALMLAACASGPSYAEAKASLIAPLRADQGRVIIYRPYHYVGGASLVTLAVNGQLIGQCPSNGFMVVDLPPGNVYARTYYNFFGPVGAGSQTMALRAGETTFLRIVPGDMSGPKLELVAARQGEADLGPCAYVSRSSSAHRGDRDRWAAAAAQDFRDYAAVSGLNFDSAPQAPSAGSAAVAGSPPKPRPAPAVPSPAPEPPPGTADGPVADKVETADAYLMGNPFPGPRGVYGVEVQTSFNVLDYITLDQASGTLALVGHRDQSFRGSRIPYLEYLATLLECPKPEFSLRMTASSAARVNALLNRTMSEAEGSRICAQWGQVVDSSGNVTDVGRRMLPALGISPIESGGPPGYLGLHTAYVANGNLAVESVDTGSPAEKAGLAKGMLITSFDGYTGNVPEEVDRKVRLGGALASHVIIVFQANGQNHRYELYADADPDPDPWRGVTKYDVMAAAYRAMGNENAAKFVSMLETLVFCQDHHAGDIGLGRAAVFDLFEVVGVMDLYRQVVAELQNGTSTPQSAFSRLGNGFAQRVEQIFGFPSGSLAGPYQSKFAQTGDFGASVYAVIAAFDGVNLPRFREASDPLFYRPQGVQIPPELVEEEFQVHPEMTPEYLGIPADSKLAGLMFRTDYLCKRIINLEDIYSQPRGYQSRFQFERAHPGIMRNEAGYHLWISVDHLDAPQSPSGTTLEFRDVKMRFNVRELDSSGRDLPNASGGYEELLTSFYPDLSHIFPSLHELQEAAKLAAAAQWLHQRKPGLRFPAAGRVRWQGPSRVPGMLYLYMYASPDRKPHVRYISAGGVSLVPFPNENAANPFKDDSSVVDLTGSSDVAPVLAYAADPAGLPAGETLPATGGAPDNEALRRILRRKIYVPPPWTPISVAVADKGQRDFQVLSVALKDLDGTPEQAERNAALAAKVREALEVSRQLARTERALNTLDQDNATAAAELTKIQAELRRDQRAFIEGFCETLDQVGDDLRAGMVRVGAIGVDSEGNPERVGADAKELVDTFSRSKISLDVREFLERATHGPGSGLSAEAVNKIPDGLVTELLKAGALDVGYEESGEVTLRGLIGLPGSESMQVPVMPSAGGLNAVAWLDALGELKLLKSVAQEEYLTGKLIYVTDFKVERLSGESDRSRATLKDKLLPLQRQLSSKLDRLLADPEVKAAFAAKSGG